MSDASLTSADAAHAPVQFSIRSLAKWTAAIAGALAVWRIWGHVTTIVATTLVLAALARRQTLRAAGKPLRTDFAVLAALSVWLSLAIIPLFSPLVFLGSLIAVLCQFRFRVAALYLAISPLGVPAAKATLDYTIGRAHLCSPSGARNLDCELRVWPNSGRQCIYRGHEWAFRLPYDGTVCVLVKTLGYMPGAYSGSYPTPNEAITALGRGTNVPLEEILADRVCIGHAKYPLAQYAGMQLLRFSMSQYLLGDQMKPITSNITAKAVLFDKDCLIIEFPVYDPSTRRMNPRETTVVLVDRDKGQRFATYERRR